MSSPIRILIDLSHNEVLKEFSEGIFKGKEVLFDFRDANDDLSDIALLSKYHLILLGAPQPPEKLTNRLFTPAEVNALKKYLHAGGSILLTLESKGDYDISRELGSIRNFINFTGIRQYPNGILFQPKSGQFHIKNTNLIINKFPKHPIFKNFTEKDKLVFGKCTYFVLNQANPPKVLLQTDSKTIYYAIKREYKDRIGEAPIFTVKNYGKGVIAVVGTTEIFMDIEERGIKTESNEKFISNLLLWLTLRAKKKQKTE